MSRPFLVLAPVLQRFMESTKTSILSVFMIEIQIPQVDFAAALARDVFLRKIQNFNRRSSYVKPVALEAISPTVPNARQLGNLYATIARNLDIGPQRAERRSKTKLRIMPFSPRTNRKFPRSVLPIFDIISTSKSMANRVVFNTTPGRI